MTVVRGRPPAELEREVYEECVKLFKATGCKVYRLSQARASKQSPGIPDLWVFPPRGKPPFWMEVKRPKGVQSVEQVAFQAQCRASGMAYVLGGMSEARHVLTAMGILRG